MGRVLPFLLAALSAIAGLALTQMGFDAVQEMRQLERVPATTAGAALPGEVNITARVQSGQALLRSRYSDTPSVYYRYRKQEKKRDADGDSSWHTLIDVSEAVDFWLADDSGRLLIEAARQRRAIDWSLPHSLQTRQGKYRHTEWRIEPGAEVFVFGFAREQARTRDGGRQLSVDFSSPGHYTPIISTLGRAHESASMGNHGLLALWSGLLLISLAVFGGVYALRVHRLLIYLTMLTLVLALVLVQLALNMMRQDLDNGMSRYQQQARAAEALVEAQLEARGVVWPGWSGAGDFTAPAYSALPPAQRLRLREIRLNLVTAHHRLQRQLQATPEKWLAPLWGIEMPAQAPPLPALDRQELQRRAATYVPARLRGVLVWVLIGAGLAATVALTWFGFRRVRHKRLIENIPTSSSQGLSCGLAEVKGEVVLAPQQAALQGPLSGADCTWYRYKVEEKRGSGKKSRWVVIEQRGEQQRFHCRDSDGRTAIEPKGADIISRHQLVKRSGRLRYRENTLRLGDPLYAIGLAAIDRRQPDQLVIAEAPAGEPFILSNYDEASIMLRKARWGMFCLNMAFAGLLLALLMGFGHSGSFAATDFLFAALAAPAYMLGLILIMHYNDLIYLRERALRNKANIEVSLRKRKNLVPNLEKLCRRYFSHERQLTELLTQMRSAHHGSIKDLGQTPAFLSVLHRAGKQFSLTLEDYPELKGNTIATKLMAGITRLENELALLRGGYNDAVELYNARIASFPDLLFSRLFRFAPLAYLHDSGA